jgi:myosin-crossreactive antigen
MATPNLTGITSVVPGILASTQLASGDNAVYTVGAGKAAKLATLILCNVSASAVTVSVAVVKSGGSVDGTHRILSGYSLAGGATATLDDIAGMWLGDGDLVSINASAATSIDVTLTGLELS